ncbi:hypothetical protein [Oryza sativa Japonica Group]|uniref:Uncharacterized protein n=1 Tax=Oryza sativa subsp. japonica TaxID=39947 RepID=Q5VP65_ORYSJ|nr:hypothetical protein [Oryza sativa Japonica Group]BAD68760.1 hypothetical protein [Oryza sativa Japonica Group]
MERGGDGRSGATGDGEAEWRMRNAERPAGVANGRHGHRRRREGHRRRGARGGGGAVEGLELGEEALGLAVAVAGAAVLATN